MTKVRTLAFLIISMLYTSAALAAGSVREVVIPAPSLRGNLVIGRWEDFIADDLVQYVDANFRTLAKKESRGVTGHSMGGFGAIRLGMPRPEVFSAVYASVHVVWTW